MRSAPWGALNAYSPPKGPSPPVAPKMLMLEMLPPMSAAMPAAPTARRVYVVTVKSRARSAAVSIKTKSNGGYDAPASSMRTVPVSTPAPCRLGEITPLPSTVHKPPAPCLANVYGPAPTPSTTMVTRSFAPVRARPSRMLTPMGNASTFNVSKTLLYDKV